MGITLNNSKLYIENYVESQGKVEHNYYGTVYKTDKADEMDDTFSPDDIFCPEKGGIGDRSQFWLLLIACMARGRRFKSIPDFNEWAFNNFQIPLDKTECLNSTQDKLKSSEYETVENQQSMISFIKNSTSQKNRRTDNLRVAQNLFVALKQIPLGEK